MNLDDAPRWDGKRIDKEIGIMSARKLTRSRSAQRTRWSWRRWRMGRDIDIAGIGKMRCGEGRSEGALDFRSTRSYILANGQQQMP